MITRVRFVLLLVTILVMSSAQAAEKSEQEYWQDAGISFTDVSQLFDHGGCEFAPELFLGCVEAIQTVLAEQDPELMLVTDEEVGGAAPLADFGVAKVVPDRSSPNREESIGRAKSRRESWLRLYSARELQPVPFRAIGDWLSSSFDLDDAELSAAAINSFLNVAFDPHTRIIPRGQYEESASSSAEVFVGIGVSLLITNGHCLVDDVYEEGSAIARGVRAGDELLKINGIPVADLIAKGGVDSLVSQIRGAKGTRVQLVVRHNHSEAPITVTVVREPIVLKNVTSKMVARGVGYLRLGSFEEEATCLQTVKALVDLTQKGAKSLILDLRGNPGGLVEQAACVAGILLGPGRLVVSEKSIHEADEGEEIRSRMFQLFRGKMVVLIDGGSASAAEIVSGALQDHRRAVVLGERSFGKGTVQFVETFEANPKLKFAHTEQRFYLPSGRTNQISGVIPDIRVPRLPHLNKDEWEGLREEDLYINAFPAVGPKWEQPRPQEIAAIEACVNAALPAREFERRSKTSAKRPDYVLLVARQALQCMKQ